MIDNLGGKRARCATCAVNMFGDAAPVDVPEDNQVLVPVLQPEFVSPKGLVQSVIADFKKRQAGESY